MTASPKKAMGPNHLPSGTIPLTWRQPQRWYPPRPALAMSIAVPVSARQTQDREAVLPATGSIAASAISAVANGTSPSLISHLTIARHSPSCHHMITANMVCLFAHAVARRRSALDGTEYEIDLNAEHAQQLRDAVAPTLRPSGGSAVAPAGPLAASVELSARL